MFSMDIQSIAEKFNTLLEPETYADVDPSTNGIQVESQAQEINHVAFAVDGATATIEAAASANADMLVVHHGIIWNGVDRISGRSYDHIQKLIKNDIALYASHLPLDGNPEVGNAAQLAAGLGIEDHEPFGEMGPVTVGRKGELTTPRSPETLVSDIEATLNDAGQEVQSLDFGPEEIESVAIVTGSGTDFLESAAEQADVLITGEGKQAAYHEAKERGINLILAGHYATETFGVQALQSMLDDEGLETTYVSHPTGF